MCAKKSNYGKPHRLERFRAKVKVKKTAEQAGRGNSRAREAAAANIKLALALRKRVGKPVSEFDGMGLDELKKALFDSRSELFSLRFRKATHQLTDVSALSSAKRKIARILTVIKQKEMGA